jgi:hypothetical protein
MAKANASAQAEHARLAASDATRTGRNEPWRFVNSDGFPFLGHGERMTVDTWFGGKGNFPGLLQIMEERFAAVLGETEKRVEAA